MNEHYCPYCRRSLFPGNHFPDCRMGQTMAGQMHQIRLSMIPIIEAVYRESRASWWSRGCWRIVNRIYGPLR